jgi:hypothetical protein
MDRAEIVHVLVDEFGNGDFGEVTVGLVADESHCKYVTQGGSDKVRMLADEQLEPTCKVLIWRQFHFRFPPFSRESIACENARNLNYNAPRNAMSNNLSLDTSQRVEI